MNLKKKEKTNRPKLTKKQTINVKGTLMDLERVKKFLSIVWDEEQGERLENGN